MDVRFRPMALWPHPATPDARRRSRYTFKAGWSATLTLLERELDMLRARNITIGCGLRESDIRLDGWPRANASPTFAGIELSFDVSDPGRAVNDTRELMRLVYATDVCAFWQHNVRSIALGLEALRAVDRHGISRRGEQYAGFAQLTQGSHGADAERGEWIVKQRFAGDIKKALIHTHPDHGGEAADFIDVNAYRALIL